MQPGGRFDQLHSAVGQQRACPRQAAAHTPGTPALLLLCRRNTDHAAARVRQACLKSLKALRLDYLDLYLIHWPVTGSVGPEVKPSIQETWQVGVAMTLQQASVGAEWQ